MLNLSKLFEFSLLATAALGLGLLLESRAGAQTPAQPPLAGDAEAGAQIFDTVCEECHGAAATAPTLRGIIGRPAASIESFYGYSDALKARKSLIWTEANLSAFLKSPTDFVPGTLMYKTVPDEKDRADLIAYLASLPPLRSN